MSNRKARRAAAKQNSTQQKTDFFTLSGQEWLRIAPVMNAHVHFLVQATPSNDTAVIVLVWQSNEVLRQLKGPQVSLLSYWYTTSVKTLEEQIEGREDIKAVLAEFHTAPITRGVWAWIRSTTDHDKGEFCVFPVVLPGGTYKGKIYDGRVS